MVGEGSWSAKGMGERTEARYENLTALGFDNGRDSNPCSCSLINQGNVTAFFDVGWLSVPLVGLPCAAIAVAGVSLHLSPACLANQGPRSGGVLHHPVKS